MNFIKWLIHCWKLRHLTSKLSPRVAMSAEWFSRTGQVEMTVTIRHVVDESVVMGRDGQSVIRDVLTEAAGRALLESFDPEVER